MNPTKNDPQGLGSCITYFRRYCYAAALGMVSEDDDGQTASSGDELATPAQIAMIKGEKLKLHSDRLPEFEALLDQLGIRNTAETTKKQASQIIDWFKKGSTHS